ncbi:hypothetical protein DXG01_007963 [Tephrocybe rancida]|nr:hypothetical protein DXG01_007963 [Tephrocybe rancida]
MPLFDIPGWSVGAPPIAEPSTTTSKKRKRPVYEPDNLKAAEANIEKLIKKLKLPSTILDAPEPLKKKNGKAATDASVSIGKAETRKLKGAKKAKKAKAVVGEQEKKSSTPVKPSKTLEKPRALPERSNKATKKHASSASSSQAAGLTALQKGMKESLDGARFRRVAHVVMINESLYKSDSLYAHQMMKEDPCVFEDYHAGFRHQVQLWPTNPVEHYISVLSTLPKKTVIADLGCGDAALARALVSSGLTVLSFDLVSDGAFVVEADICSKIPLPGSEPTPSQDEKSDGEGHIVDVVVCALSLMGTNWPNCLREAWRILKSGGELKIAEVASRFTDIEGFQTLVGSLGFRLKSKDDRNSHFTLFEFKKVANKGKSEKEWGKVLARASLLKPCEYKRRSDNEHVSTPHIESEISVSTLPVMTSTAKVNVLSHPVVNAGLSKLRQSTTGPKEFREGIHQISLILGIEATRHLEESIFEGETPVGPFTGTTIKPRIGLTPILRAGLGMTDALVGLFEDQKHHRLTVHPLPRQLTLFPNAPVYHLGLFREKVTLQPVECEEPLVRNDNVLLTSYPDYSKLPPSPPVEQVFLLDPLIATGGTACAALAMIVDWGIPVKDVKLLCVLASKEGLAHIQAEYPELEIWAAGVDQDLTPEGIISPGLGDTGDRLFSTIIRA